MINALMDPTNFPIIQSIYVSMVFKRNTLDWHYTKSSKYWTAHYCSQSISSWNGPMELSPFTSRYQKGGETKQDDLLRLRV